MIPGPKEPNTEQLNELLEPLAEDVETLYEGEKYSVHGFANPLDVYGTLPFVTSDTPARLKVGGYVSQNSEEELCIICKKPFSSLVHPHCFDRDSEPIYSFERHAN